MRNEKVLKQLTVAAFLFSAISVFAHNSASAQGTSTQTANDKHSYELKAKILEDSAKMAKYKGMIPQFEKDQKNTADQAQQSADDNKKAAEKLSNDPQDKRLARKADESANDARRDARKARVAADKLDDLNKDIKKLTKQLEKEQAKLDKYQQAAATAAAAASPPAMQKDSVSH